MEKTATVWRDVASCIELVMVGLWGRIIKYTMGIMEQIAEEIAKNPPEGALKVQLKYPDGTVKELEVED
jgi:hypothetical protein